MAHIGHIATHAATATAATAHAHIGQSIIGQTIHPPPSYGHLQTHDFGVVVSGGEFGSIPPPPPMADHSHLTTTLPVEHSPFHVPVVLNK